MGVEGTDRQSEDACCADELLLLQPQQLALGMQFPGRVRRRRAVAQGAVCHTLCDSRSRAWRQAAPARREEVLPPGEPQHLGCPGTGNTSCTLWEHVVYTVTEHDETPGGLLIKHAASTVRRPDGHRAGGSAGSPGERGRHNATRQPAGRGSGCPARASARPASSDPREAPNAAASSAVLGAVGTQRRAAQA